ISSASNNPNSCILDCQGLGRGFNFHSYETSATVIEGLTIRNGKADIGGGIKCVGSGPTIMSCIFANNASSLYGGGLDDEASMSNLTLSHCTFANNTAGGSGGGIVIYGASATVTNCTFTGNSARGNGGGIFGFSYPIDAHLTATNCILIGNS